MADGDNQKQNNQINFNIQEILGDNSASDVSFQNMVQNISTDGFPADLQQILSTNGTDDLDLLWGGDNNKDGNSSKTATGSNTSTPLQQHQQPHTPNDPQDWVMPATSPLPPNVHVMPAMSMPMTSQPMTSQPLASQPMAPQPPVHSPVAPSPAPLQMQNQQQQPQSQPQPQPLHQSQPQPQGAASSTTLLDNITSQLPPERREQFIELFKELQAQAVSPDQFLSQAKSLLGQQQYQQLEDLKNKPGQDKQPANKRPISSAQTMPGLITPQLKRVKQEPHIPAGMPMGPPLSNPMTAVFKTPAGLQIPRPMPGPAQSVMKPSPAISATAPSGAVPAPIASASGGVSSGGGGGGSDRIDYDTLTDVMGYAGVDLREEAEHFFKDGDAAGVILPDGIDRSKTQDFMNSELLKERIMKIAKPHQIANIDQDFLSYLALATQERLRGLVEQMVSASKHRVMSQSASTIPPVDENGHPLYKIVVQQESKKQLLAIERAEREEERKRKEAIAERERRQQMGEGDGVGEEGRPKKKKKDKESGQGGRGLGDGSGRDSETALIKAIGGIRKSWMLTGKDQPTPGGGGGGSVGGIGSPAGIAGGASPLSGGSGNIGIGGIGLGAAGAGGDAPRGRGRPRGRKAGEGGGIKRGAGRGRGAGGRDLGNGMGLLLPPSTIGRTHRLGDPGVRKVTVKDAIFALEKDCQTVGRAGGQRTLLKTYNQWLK